MNRITKLFALASLVTAFAIPSIASAQGVGSANIQKIFTDIRETKDLESKLKEKDDLFKAKQQEANTRLTSLRQSRDQFKAGSPEWSRANDEFSRTAMQLQVEIQVQQLELVREQKRQTKVVFDKAVAAIAEVAKARNLSMVISQTIPPEPSEDVMDQLKIGDLINLLRQQNLLYVAPDIDITSEVITKLDAAYASTHPAAPAPAAPANPTGGAGGTPGR